MKTGRRWIATAAVLLAAGASFAARAQGCDPAASPCHAGAAMVHGQGASRAPSTENIAPAGVGALDSAMGTELSGGREPAWLALPKSLAAPDSSVAWIFGLGFLGYVILRRVRAAPSY